ncbi:hypothetical protein V6N13_134013 [Hibiscus sabdariffa]
MRSQTKTVGSIFDPTAQIKADQGPSSPLATWHHLSRWIRSDPTAQIASRPRDRPFISRATCRKIHGPTLPRVIIGAVRSQGNLNRWIRSDPTVQIASRPSW